MLDNRHAARNFRPGDVWVGMNCFGSIARTSCTCQCITRPIGVQAVTALAMLLLLRLRVHIMGSLREGGSKRANSP